jgi:hypothetical protein
MYPIIKAIANANHQSQAFLSVPLQMMRNREQEYVNLLRQYSEKYEIPREPSQK